MASILVIGVRLHDHAFHGVGDAVPSPARLFQALVAGAGLSGPLLEKDRGTLKWLEELPKPTIAIPIFAQGKTVSNFVPNNDLDAVDGNLGYTSKIRGQKIIRPLIFYSSAPLFYIWDVTGYSDSEEKYPTLKSLAERLYQFGRGVDLAWAWCEYHADDSIFWTNLFSQDGIDIYRTTGGLGIKVACPTDGTLSSLIARHKANLRCFTAVTTDKKPSQLLEQRPKPYFVHASYNCPPRRTMYDFRSKGSLGSTVWLSMDHASLIVEDLRNLAAARLTDVVPQLRQKVERYLIGRSDDNEAAVNPGHRVRIIALPSIGHTDADRAIRRVLIEIPRGCPLRADDVQWAFSGLSLQSADSSLTADLTPAGDDSMLQHYGIGNRYRVWQTVTPAALPQSARRRRIDPLRICDEAKGAEERIAEESRACSAVLQAMRHAGLKAGIEVVRVQREPFHLKGLRAESFAPGTRFEKERLWHVQIEFTEPVEGPLLIGDGRFLGLGLMAPVKISPRVHAFEIEDGLENRAESNQVTYALRRAVMARVQKVIGERSFMPSFFTGHERDGSTVRGGRETHLLFAFDPSVPRILVIAPGASNRHLPKGRYQEHLKTLDKSLAGFNVLRAGRAGCLILKPQVIETEHDSLFQRACVWESVTPYAATRHVKQKSAFEALAEDLRSECLADKLPTPEIEVLEARGIVGVGLVGRVRLRFAVAVGGPILLGKDRFQGGGLFRAVLP